MVYTIVVDKQSRENPSGEQREFDIEVGEELRRKGDIYDEICIKDGKAKLIRRISIGQYKVTKILDNPIETDLGKVKLQLFEGDNYIYVKDKIGNHLYAEYLVKNDFNNIYVIKAELDSAIEQTSRSISLSVNQKLEDYSTTEEMQSAIEIKANSITSTVESTYATKGELNTAKSEIKQTTDAITSTVSKKVGNDEIISKINQSAEKITIDADKIDINGKAVKFKTNIQQSFGPYTQADAERALKIMTGAINPSSSDYNKYDIDGDKSITSVDLARIKRAINNGGYYNASGSFEIDPYSAQKSVKIYNEKGVPISILSVLTNYFSQIDIDGGIEFRRNDNGIRGYINSEFVQFEKEGTNNSLADIGVISVNGEMVGSLTLNSSYGSINAWTTSDVGAQIIVSKQNGTQTIITPDDIECPRLDVVSGSSATRINPNGVTTPSLSADWGSIVDFHQGSLEELKKNIAKTDIKAIDVIKNADIYSYNLKTEKDTDKKHIGFVIGKKYKTPSEVIAKSGDGIDTYTMSSIEWKALQEIANTMENLQKRVQALEEK